MYLFQEGSNIVLLISANSKRTFTGSGSPPTYTAPDNSPMELTHDATAAEYIITDKVGNARYTFHDFTVAATGERGKLKERSSLQWKSQGKAGLEYSYDISGKISQITTANGQDYNIVFTYSGTSISKVEVKDGLTLIAQAEYTYYGDVVGPTTDLGSSGDLVQVKVSRDATGDTPGTLSVVRYTQYRYDAGSRLKAVYDNDAVERIIAGDAGISTADDILTKADAYGTPAVSTFAGRSFTYYTANTATSNIVTPFNGTGEDLNTLYGGSEAVESGFAKSETIGAGCSSCGSTDAGQTKTYFYLDIAQGATLDQNEVTRLVIEDTEDSGGTAVYRTIYGMNDTGRLLRKVFIDDPTGSPTYWCESTKMATTGKESRAAEERMPSAHAVTTAANLRTFLDPFDSEGASWTNDDNTLNASAGLIKVYTYSTEGMRTDSKVKQGKNGTAYYVSATDYGDGDGDGTGDDNANKTLTIATYSYPTKTTTRTDGKKTSYSYTFWDTNDREIKTKTTTLPVISTGQNGSGVATATVEYYDNLGRLRWTKDGEGYINYYAHNPVTGGEAYVSIDVDPASPGTDVTSGSAGNWDAWTIGSANTNKPTRDSGLPTVLDLVTKTYYDDQGRQTRTVDDGGAEHYTVYENLRTIQFPYWDSTSSVTLMPIQISKLNDGGQLEQLIGVKAGYTSISTASGAPTGFSTEPVQGDYVSWTRHNRSTATGRRESVDRYHDIPSSGDGTLSTNYYRSVTNYDAMGRVEYTIQVVSGSSAADRKEQVTQRVYDVRDRVIEVKSGVSGDSASNSHNMTDTYDSYPTLRTISKIVYDDGGVGDGYVTKTMRYHGTGANDYTGVNPKLTYRGHQRGVEPFYMNGSTETPYGPFAVSDVNWQGQTTDTALYDTAPTWSAVLTGDGYTDYADSTTTNRRTRSETLYDDLGRVYRTNRYKIDASTGSGSNALVSKSFYDRNGQQVATAQDYGSATETAYDGAGRAYQTRTVLQLATTKYSSGAFQYRAPVPNPTLSSMTGGDDWVLEMNHSAYDGNNLTQQHTFEDNHDDAVSATRGIDLTNNDDYVRRSNYSWYDAADRLTATADYGSGDTTAGAGAWKYSAVPTRPGTAPTSSSDTKLVMLVSYNADTGAQETITDPAGTKTKSFVDDLGRSTYTAENYDNFNAATEANTGDATDKSKDRVTKFTYNGLGGRVTLVAMDANADGTLTDNQTTAYLFEDAVNASLTTNEIYPDSSDTTSSGTDQVKFQFNTDGSQSKRTDQRGTVLDFTYTNERRPELTKVTTLGGSTDGQVRAIGRSYDGMGRQEKLTSYANSDGTGTVRSEIQYVYNDLDQVTTSYQSHEGVVNTGTTNKVQYGYDATTSGTVFSRQHRLEKVTYPDSRVIFYDYDATNADYPAHRLSRIDKIRETSSTGTILSEYDYNGTGRLAIVDLPEPDIKLDYFQGTSGSYAGFDRFGRKIDHRWYDYTTGTVDVARYKYGYDYNNSRTWKEDTVAATNIVDLDEFYSYDGLSRLKAADRGNLNGTKTAVSTLNFGQDWDQDQLNNWSNFTEDSDGNGTNDLDQDRSHNDANEITDITETTGPSWTTPTHDAAGNMSSIPQPTSPTSAYTLTWDAWNRLVKLADGTNTVAEYEYDGNNRRIVKKIYANGVLDETRHIYLSWRNQVLEERIDASANAAHQFTWGARYIDDLVLRTRDTDDNGSPDETLYALQDANWNITSVADTSGTIAERFVYNSYGKTTVLDGDFTADADGISDTQWEYRFTSREHDSETNLQYFRARFYHDGIGRFVGRDPLEFVNGMSLYAGYFVPNGADPTGLDCDCKDAFDRCFDEVDARKDSCRARGVAICSAACAWKLKLFGKGAVAVCITSCLGVYTWACGDDWVSGRACCRKAKKICEGTGEQPGWWWWIGC